MALRRCWLPLFVAAAACRCSSAAVVYTSDGTHSSCSLDRTSLGSTGTGAAWCALLPGGNSITLDAGTVGAIASVTTQGRFDVAQWVTAYSLYYSTDAATWTLFGSLAGNVDQETRVTKPLNVVARYLKLLPTAWTGHASMRVGLTINGTECGFLLSETTLGVCPPNAYCPDN